MKRAIVAFDFFEVFSVTSLIKKIASERAKLFNCPIFTNIRDFGIGQEIFYFNSRKSSVFSVAKEIFYWAKKEGITDIWLVTPKLILGRFFRDLERIINENGGGLNIYSASEIWYFSDDLWYQSLTSKKFFWLKAKEFFLLKVLPFFIYKKLAG